MSHLQPIYAVWNGNAEAMAADIDELGVTVRQWRNRGDIPSRAWPKIIQAAASRGVVIPLDAFLPAEVRSQLHAAPHSRDHDASATNMDASAGEADSHGPFSSTCSPMNAPSGSSASSRSAPEGAARASASCRSSAS